MRCLIVLLGLLVTRTLATTNLPMHHIHWYHPPPWLRWMWYPLYLSPAPLAKQASLGLAARGTSFATGSIRGGGGVGQNGDWGGCRCRFTSHALPDLLSYHLPCVQQHCLSPMLQQGVNL